MSTKDKLLAKTGDLTLPPVAPLAATPPAPALPPARPEPSAAAAPPIPRATPPAIGTLAAGQPPARTGPGQMLQFRGQMLAVEGELKRLREQLQAHEGSLPTRPLDAATIAPSRWANRHADAFNTPDFIRLKQDIELAGGNVQPIRVRPLQRVGDEAAGGELAVAGADAGVRYEVIFGHRRHRACLELGLPVLATIDTEPVSDLALFAAMDRENRERADLSPYEQGVMYRHALDEQLYPSNRRLAEALGVSHTWVANVLAVADLPPPVIACFRTPLDIQHRHAKALAPLLERQRKAVLRRAEKIRLQSPRPDAAQVVAQLLGDEPAARKTLTRAQPLVLDGRTVGHWRRDGDGGLDLHLNPELVAGHDLAVLVEALVRRCAVPIDPA